MKACRQGVVVSDLMSPTEVKNDAASTALLLDLVFDTLQSASGVAQGREIVAVEVT